MYEIIFVILVALACPHHNNTANSDNKGFHISMAADTGGETGNPPPKPPTGGKP